MAASIAVPVIYIDANGTINITIENATGNVIVQIEGLNDTSVALNDGIATYVLPILEEGKYNITVTYDGDNKYSNSTATSEFEVVKYTPEINIDVDDVSVIENATLTVNVGNATGNVTIKVDEDEETVELENGSATVVLDLLPAGVHNITVTYNGDDLFYEAVNETSFNVSKIDTESLLSLYSIVFQDVTLFNNTVLENIRIGDKNATDEQVKAAAELANCTEFVEHLPDKWNTIIGENGKKLSGGERQRISIARAFLKNAPIILLDEASASLDVENETLIQQSLSKLIKGKTVLVIAHRMRTVQGANKIITIKDGKAEVNVY